MAVLGKSCFNFVVVVDGGGGGGRSSAFDIQNFGEGIHFML